MTTMPPPQTPLPSWATLVAALWGWGRRHVTDAELVPWLDHAHAEMTREHESGGPEIRPSGNIHCAMKSYLRLRGIPGEPMPSWLAVTFNTGHLIHAHSYAFIESSLPACFEAEYEKPIDLSLIPWWPEPELARQEGSADMVLRIVDADAAARYLSPSSSRPQCLVDFKSMSDWSFKKHSKGFPEDAPDTFGYLSQLPVYREVLGAETTDCVLAGINRNNMRDGCPLGSRPIDSAFLDEELVRVRERLTNPAPRPELVDVWGKKADFSCDAVKGTCSDRMRCSEFRSGLEV
jgi:hypothetical protein